MNVSAPPKFGMGASPHRIEDGSLIRGKGRYTVTIAARDTSGRTSLPVRKTFTLR